jgi:hypothetical protein
MRGRGGGEEEMEGFLPVLHSFNSGGPSLTFSRNSLKLNKVKENKFKHGKLSNTRIKETRIQKVFRKEWGD